MATRPARKFDPTRTFGVEVEFTGADTTANRNRIAAQFRALGCNVQNSSYFHTTQSYWKLIQDGSCGLELVSPILKGAAGLEEVRKVLNAAVQMGLAVNDYCGLHVHHSAAGMTTRELRRLITLYCEHEEVIFRMLPTRRWDGGYCRPLMYERACYESVCGDPIDPQVARARAINLTALQSSFANVLCGDLAGSRYYALNLRSYLRHGTVEFRALEGTLDPDLVEAWVLMTQGLVIASFLPCGRISKVSLATLRWTIWGGKVEGIEATAWGALKLRYAEFGGGRKATQLLPAPAGVPAPFGRLA